MLLPLYSGGRRYCVSAGLEHVVGVHPIEANFEHPPLAEYVIGFRESVGLRHACFIAAVYFGCVGVRFRFLRARCPWRDCWFRSSM